MPQLDALYSDLNRIVGETGLLPSDKRNDYYVDGFIPKAVVSPSSVEQIQDFLAFARDRGFSVIPAGSGTKIGIGNPPEKVDLVLSTQRLNNVVEYEPDDLTVTVQSGVQLTHLQAKLRDNSQFLPLDPAYANRATVGGIAAANASGPLRLRHGTPRNRVLGMHVVQSSGVVVKSGGKVVKNVAGYDLNKLYIGAFGTLGIITELTFKLYPLPENERTVLLTFKKIEDAVRVASEITDSQLSPCFLNLFINGVPSTRILNPSLVAGLDGPLQTVAWQGNQLESIAKQGRAIAVETMEEAQAQSLVEAMHAFSEDNQLQKNIVCKVNLRMTDIHSYVKAALESSNALGRSIRVMALMGTGQVYLVFSELSKTIENRTAANALTKLREHTMRIGGNLTIEAAPVELKRQIDVWGTVGRSAKIMKQIKARLDPGGLLNPGRFVAGI